MRAVQLSGESPDWRIEAVAFLPRADSDIPLSENDARRLWDVIGRQNFVGDKVVIGVPEESLASAIIKNKQHRSPAMRDRFICDEFARASSLDASRSEMACWELPTGSRGDNTPDVMAVGCAHESAEALLDAAEAAGFEVVALDVAGAAAARWLTCLSERDSMTAVVDVEWNSAGVIVVNHDTVVYERAIPEAQLAHLYEEIKKQKGLNEEMFELLMRDVGFGADTEEAKWAEGASNVRTTITAHFDRLAHELKTALSYVAHQYQDVTLSQAFVIGDGSRITGLHEYLSNELGVDVGSPAISKIAMCPKRLEKFCESTELAGALGFAQHGL